MIHPELEILAQRLDLENEEHFSLRVEFGVACIERVEHLLTDVQVIESLSAGKGFVSGTCSSTALREAASTASKLASSHAGSGSIDGAGSAAVTTSRGVAAALAGRALDAAGYAAYASVYAYAGYSVTDLSAYESEHSWQISKLKLLAHTPAD